MFCSMLTFDILRVGNRVVLIDTEELFVNQFFVDQSQSLVEKYVRDPYSIWKIKEIGATNIVIESAVNPVMRCLPILPATLAYLPQEDEEVIVRKPTGDLLKYSGWIPKMDPLDNKLVKYKPTQVGFPTNFFSRRFTRLRRHHGEVLEVTIKDIHCYVNEVQPNLIVPLQCILPNQEGIKGNGGTVTTQSTESLYCSCSSPLLKSNWAGGELFQFCSICKKERR